MAELLHCTVTVAPACGWTGSSERALIGHYLEAHHHPTAADFIGIYESLRSAHLEIAQLHAQLERVDG